MRPYFTVEMSSKAFRFSLIAAFLSPLVLSVPRLAAKESDSSGPTIDQVQDERYAQGKRLLEQGRYEEATAAFQAAIAHRQPSSQSPGAPAPSGLLRARLAKWHAQQAQQSYQSKKYLAAIVYAERAVELDAEDRQSLQLIRSAKQALREQQRNLEKAAVLSQRAKTAEEHGEVEQALGLWKKALKFSPDDEQAKVGVERLQARWQQKHPPIKKAAELTTTTGYSIPADEEYRVSIGDVLEVFVWQQPDLSRDVVVRPDGKISFPLVGDMLAVNHTLTQLDDALTERLKIYVKYPDVSLAIKRFGGTKTIVLGEVGRPGIYVPTGEGRALDVIAMAGGFSPNADSKDVFLIRGGLASPQMARLDLKDALLKGQLEENVLLQPNDILYVARQGKTAWANIKQVLDELAPIMSETLVFQSVATNFGAREFQRTGRSVGVE